MQRTLFALIALVAVALPASASADHRHQADSRISSSYDRPARTGFVTVDNPNQVALQVTIDGRSMGSVGPGEIGRYGPLPEGRHKVSVQFACNRRGLNRRVYNQRITVDSRRPARIQLPELDLVIVELSNRWIERMDISIDGHVVGFVRANGRTSLIAASHRDLTLITPSGARAMTVFLSEHGLATQTMTLMPPRHASVTISNPTRARLQLLDGNGNVLCDLAPWSTERIRMASGWTGLAVRYRGRTVDSTKLIASPFSNNRWDISPRLALYDDYDDGRGRRNRTTSNGHHHHPTPTRVSWRTRWSYVW
jgi:hypothetical protein